MEETFGEFVRGDRNAFPSGGLVTLGGLFRSVLRPWLEEPPTSLIRDLATSIPYIPTGRKRVLASMYSSHLPQSRTADGAASNTTV